MVERRSHHRFRTYAVAGLVDEETARRWVGLATNVSLGGLAIRTRARLVPGDAVRVHMVHAGRTIRREAVVVRVSKLHDRRYTQALALEFLDEAWETIAGGWEDVTAA